MRYFLAMLCGVVGAGLAAKFVAIEFAPWFSRQFSYDSPLAAESADQWAFIAVLVGGLIIGWAVGWMLGYPFRTRKRGR